MRPQANGWTPSEFTRRKEGPAIFVASHVVAAPQFSPDVAVAQPLPVDRGVTIAAGVFSVSPPPPLELHFPVELGSGGLSLPWVQAQPSQLWVPAEVDFESRFEASMYIKVLLTPDSLFPQIDPDLLARTAWWVLSRSDPEFVAFVAAQLSLVQEVAVMHSQLSQIVQAMTIPELAITMLSAEVATTGRVFDQRVLRDVVCECAAAASAGTWTSVPPPADDDIVLCALFPPNGPNLRSVPAIVTALWLLQAAVPNDEEMADLDAFSVASALGYQSAVSPLGWIGLAERIIRHWSVPDDHSAVTHAKPRPSALRSHVASRLGVTPSEFIAGTVQVAALLSVGIQQGETPVLADEYWNQDALASLGTNFRAAIESQLTISFEQLGAEVLSELSTSYTGVGSVQSGGAELLRNSPLVRFGDAVVPVGFQALVESSAVALRRVGQSASGAPGPTLGYMLEATAVDGLARLSGRHTYISSEQIDAVVPRGSKRCDAILVSDGRWLLIEIGAQSPNPRERVGARRDLIRRCRDYHEKLDQAEATQNHLAAIAAAVGIAPPRSASMILVVAEPIFATVPLLGELAQVRPGRQPRFVVSVSEVEDLVRLGSITDIPLLVEIWQTQQKYASISGAMEPLFKMFGNRIAPPPRVDLHALLPEGPTLDSEAA